MAGETAETLLGTEEAEKSDWVCSRTPLARHWRLCPSALLKNIICISCRHPAGSENRDLCSRSMSKTGVTMCILKMKKWRLGGNEVIYPRLHKEGQSQALN